MRKILVAALLYVIAISAEGQGVRGVLGKLAKRDSTGRSTVGNVINSISSGSKDSLSNNTIVSGLKEALAVGTERGVATVSSVDGFFRNAALKILMPTEAQKVEQKLRALGLGKQVDNAILSMNRAAEDASKKAVPVFVDAIKQMSITDALGILRGGDSAATTFLRARTTAQLTNAFRPIVEESLVKVDATKYWNGIFSTYNRFSSNQVNTDLTAYVTERALSGIFRQVSLEEQKIRKDPAARTTQVLKQVFGSKL